MSNFKPNYFQRRSKPRGPKANERIKAIDVQVIGSNGGNLGTLPLNKAIEIAKFDNLSVYFSHPVVFFANRNPLFYCKGVDSRRNCNNRWVDIAEDGLNGNEELYMLSTPSL